MTAPPAGLVDGVVAGDRTAIGRALTLVESQRADIHIEPQVGERRADHLLAPVVAVLANLGHQDPGSTPCVSGEDVHPISHGAHPVAVSDLA